MRQIFGYLLVLCSIPLLLLIGSEVWKELEKSQKHEHIIEQSIVLPEVDTPALPVTLYDANNQGFSDENYRH